MATASKFPVTVGSVSDCAEMASLFSKAEELTRSSGAVIERTNAIILESMLRLSVLGYQGNCWGRVFSCLAARGHHHVVH
jgi:hypothetical protein